MNTKLIKIFFSFFFIASIISFPTFAASSEKPYVTYNYSLLDESQIPSPSSYLPDKIFRGEKIIDGGLNNPQDLFISDDGTVLIADTGNNRVIITDLDFKDSFAISGVNSNDLLKAPQGVFLSEDGLIYVADTGNGRIVCFKSDGTFNHIIPQPQSELLGEEFIYTPIKIAVSSLGNIYVVCENIYQGILEITSEGEFLGFAGSNQVSPTLWERFWRAVSTQEQKSAMTSFIPVGFSNLCLDANDFILATTKPDEDDGTSTFKRLNPSGKDVWRKNSAVRTIGDLGNIWNGKVSGNSIFVDIASMPGGIVACLDSKRCRIFIYDSDGYLMTVFGFSGSQDGLLTSPVAISAHGRDLYVLDSPKNTITLYLPTKYGSSLLLATEYYYNGDYEAATAEYERVYSLNSNSELAYIGIGKTQLREGKYKEAMDSFRLANNKELYSRAFEEYRKEMFSKYFFLIFSVAFVGIIALFVISYTRNKKKTLLLGYADSDMPKNKLGRYTASFDFTFYYIFHPFKGANELKYEKKGTTAGAVTWIVLFVITVTESRLMSGYLFTSGSNKVNSFLFASASLLIVILWCVSNWCITSLTDGEGSFRDIYISAAYSLAPFVLIQIPLTAVSNLLTLQEAAFYIFFYILSVVWAAALLIVGNMTIHNVSMKRALLTVFLTIAGMVIVLVMGFLIINLCYMVFEFMRTVHREIIYRI